MIFVTGGTGYTGQRVVAELIKREKNVTCLVRETSDVSVLPKKDVSLVTGTLDDVDGWATALADVDAVISVAHIQYAPFVIDACKKQGVSRVIFISSTWRFSKVKTPAVASVIRGEEAVLQSGLDYTILRPTMIYGPGDDRNISRLCAFMEKYAVMPVFGSGEKRVQPIYVTDVAQAVADVLVCDDTIGKCYDLGGAVALRYHEMIDHVAAGSKRVVVKVHIPIFLGLGLAILGQRLFAHFPIQEDQIQRMKEDSAFDISEAKAAWGFEPLTFEAGLKRVRSSRGASTL